MATAGNELLEDYLINVFFRSKEYFKCKKYQLFFLSKAKKKERLEKAYMSFKDRFRKESLLWQ